MAALGIAGLWRWIVGGLIVLILIGAGVGYVMVRPYAQIGATYIATQMCSCVFVAGRTEASCHAEFEPDIDKFKVSVRHGKPGHGGVRASLVIFSGAARYTGGYGCTVAK